MTKAEIAFYHDRTVKRLVDLVNKQMSEAERNPYSWLTKRMIEDNKLMAEMLSAMAANAKKDDYVS
jgi:hypothetical protein